MRGAELRSGVMGLAGGDAVLDWESATFILEIAASKSLKLMWVPEGHESSLVRELSPLVEALGVTWRSC